MVEEHSVFIPKCNHQPEFNSKAIVIDLCLYAEDQHSQQFTWDNFTKYTQVDDDHTLTCDAVIKKNFRTWDAVITGTQVVDAHLVLN